MGRLAETLLVVGTASALSAVLCFLYGKLPLEATLGLFFLASLASVVIPLTLQSLPLLEHAPFSEQSKERSPTVEMCASSRNGEVGV